MLAGEELLADLGQVATGGQHVAVLVVHIADPDAARRRRGDLHQPAGAAGTARLRVQMRLLVGHRRQRQPVHAALPRVALQQWTDRFQALAVRRAEGVADLVGAPVDALESHVLVGRRAVVGEEAVDGRAQGAGIAAHVPGHVGAIVQHQVAVDAQLRQHLGPAFGDGLLDHGEAEDACLDHFHHILDGQGSVQLFDTDRCHAALRQALVDQLDGALGGAAGRQRDGPPGQLLQARVAPVAFARHQHQRHIGAHRRARADLQAVVRRQQFAGGDQVAFATLQGGKQLVLGLGYELEGEVPRGRRAAVEVLLEGAQATVLDADRLALHLARAVAALVDQHLEHASAADARQVAGLRLFPVPVVRLAGDARSRRQGCEHQQAKRKQQQTRHPGLQRPGSMSLSGGPDQSEHGSLGKFLSDSGCKRRHWVDNPGAEEPDLRL